MSIRIAVPTEFQTDLRRATEAEQRYLQTGDRTALDEAAALWKRIMDHPAFPKAPERFQLAALNDSGGTFLRRYWAAGCMKDLNYALTNLRRAVERSGPNSNDLPTYLNNLGLGLDEHYTQTSEIEDLEEAIQVWRWAVERTDPESPDLPGYLNNLGNGLRDRYARSDEIEDLEKAIDAYRRAVERAGSDSSDLPSILNNLGLALSDRYGQTGEVEDLEEAVQAWRGAMERADHESPELTGYLNNLGAGLHDRYARMGKIEDLEEAIGIWRKVVERTDSSSLELPGYLSNLATGLGDRYSHSGKVEDLEEAIRIYRQALARTDVDSPNLCMYLNNLGNGLHDRYARTGEVEALEEAIRLWRRAVHRTDPDCLDLPMYLNSLGNGLHDRYAVKGELEDLEEAIQVWRRTVRRTGPESPFLPSRLNNLGTGLHDRYARMGDLEDLEETIRVYRRAVERAEPESPDLPSFLGNLGNGLSDRYARMGNIQDLEEAIRVHRRAVTRTGLDSPDLPGFLNSLGTALLDRYTRTGATEDLENAIRVWRSAVEQSDPESPDLPMYLNNLGLGLADSYAQTGEVEDLEKAIRVYRQAVERSGPESPNLPSFLNNLGNGLHDRYVRIGEVEDLEEAIRVWRRALERAEPDSPDLPMRLSNLGIGLSDRYVRTGDLEDREEAIRVYRRALDRSHPESPNMPMYLNNLGLELSDRYTQTREPEDLEKAIDVYRRALAALDREYLLSPVSYQLGQQARWSDLIAHVVNAHCQADQLSRALAIAEGSKSRLLVSLLGRQALPAPPSITRKLAEQEQELAAELANLDAADLARRGRVAVESNTLSQRRALLDQLLDIWEEMGRHGSDAEDYVALRRGDRPRSDDLERLVDDLGAKVAVLSFFDIGERILLFVLRAGEASPQVVETPLDHNDLNHVFLTNYRDEILNRPQLRRIDRPVMNRWREMGRLLLTPTLPYLEGVEHLVLVPNGALHMVPLHALTLNDDGETLLDRFVVSYIPALRLLDRVRQREPVEAKNIAVWGYTPADSSTSRGVTERRLFLGEARGVADQLGASPVLNADTGSGQLRRALDGSSLRLLHLSCHGRFDPQDPLNSGVLLSDGVLTAREWMNLHFRADLVTLSACQTGMAGSLGGDEMAGMTQALLYAGASSLVVGLWSVSSATTRALMIDFYRRLWDSHGSERPDKATALREATLALRRGDLIPPQSSLDPSDPYYWAPFMLVGDWR